MTNAVAEETKDTSVQEGQEPETPVKEESKEPEVDWDRARRDEDYLDEVNTKLRGEQTEEPKAEEPVAEKAEEAKQQEPAAEKVELDEPRLEDDPVVETILYRGQEVPVRRSQMKDLLQKGRHLEVRLQEVAPALKLMKSNPELFEVLEKNPDAIAKILGAAKGGKSEVEVPEIEGYDKEDVKVVATVLDKLLEKRDMGKRESQVAVAKARAEKSRQYLDALSVADPNFEKNYSLIPSLLGELERTLPKEQFSTFVQAIDNPDEIDPETGKPVFFQFYKEVDAERRRRESMTDKQTAPAPKKAVQFKPAPKSSGLIEPGAASPGRTESSGGVKNPWNMGNDEFTKMWNAKLRGDD